MRKGIMSVFLFFITINMVFAAQINGNLSPVGLWKTIDDVTQKPKGIVSLQVQANQTLNGKIITFIPSEGKTIKEVCTECKGGRHNQPIVGLIFLENMKQDQSNHNKWTGGMILDPKTGRTYRCDMLLVDGGSKLRVRGYVGFPLFGRTQIWHRTNSSKL